MSKAGWLLALLVFVAGSTDAQQELAPSTDDGPMNIRPVPPRPDENGVYRMGPGIELPVLARANAAAIPSEDSGNFHPFVCILSMVIGVDGVPRNIQAYRSTATRITNWQSRRSSNLSSCQARWTGSQFRFWFTSESPSCVSLRRFQSYCPATHKLAFFRQSLAPEAGRRAQGYDNRPPSTNLPSSSTHPQPSSRTKRVQPNTMQSFLFRFL